MRRTAQGRRQPSANPGASRDQTERSRRRLLASYLFFLVIISELPFLSVHNLSGDTPCYNRGMDVIVCHISALHYWLSQIGSPRIDALQSALAPQLGIPLRESEIAAAVSILPKKRQREKVHLLTKTHEAARHSHDIRFIRPPSSSRPPISISQHRGSSFARPSLRLSSPPRRSTKSSSFESHSHSAGHIALAPTTRIP